MTIQVDDTQTCRHFVTCSGVRLPLRLVEEIDGGQLGHRNTVIRSWPDDAGALIGSDKVVYGEIELSHRYAYRGDGTLAVAEIVMLDDDFARIYFDKAGVPVADSVDA
ncbi:hypothetical protein WSK_1742 [Novosphingobium sp. Rr 2-17]|uniref:DUF6156 family protein n=1 Tax=Novosphingobium sp. Rr 2-17 TaxID=555793 RepID=UPI000269A4F6|nr:DUF6156 family protein [Novosphingobium sp. Rr 2-17]EIZ79662.1 hypothetical protein WSK_1742 [Novosphingobium sp. Rr 2-17]